jgi:serine/threonine protein kinase
LGEGAFGKVCKVFDKQTNLERAMKAIKKTSIKDNEKREKLFSEVKILKNTDHPNVLKLYEFY